MEYDHPARTNLVIFSVLIVLWLSLREYWFAALWFGIMLIRMWGMREGGGLRRRMQQKYGWE